MRGRQFVMPRRLGALGLLRQHRERRLQPVREVARLRQRAGHRPLAMLEQGVEIVDERLHLGRIDAVDPPLAAVVHFTQARRAAV